MYVLSKNIKYIKIFLVKFSVFTAEKNLYIQGRRRRCGRSGECQTTILADHGILRTAFFSIAAVVLSCTLQPHYNAPHYNAVFNITRPCHGSQVDYFAICL